MNQDQNRVTFTDSTQRATVAAHLLLIDNGLREAEAVELLVLYLMRRRGSHVVDLLKPIASS
jgi:hypothetical protein